jgi:poly(beta-D-mannuronate) lyase
MRKSSRLVAVSALIVAAMGCGGPTVDPSVVPPSAPSTTPSQSGGTGGAAPSGSGQDPGASPAEAGAPSTATPASGLPTPPVPPPSGGTPPAPDGGDGIPAAKRTLVATSLEELEGLIAGAVPGDRIELADGTYVTSNPIEVSCNGTEADPIVITARNVGGATIGGAAGFNVQGSYLVIRGFKLAHAIAGERGFVVRDSHHVRITRNEFAIRDTTESSIWLYIDGVGSAHNRIDHNFFHDKASRNVFLALLGDAPDGDPAMSQEDRIDHNYFLSQTYPEEGGECIRIGDSKRGPLSAHTLVDSNLFEKCDGDPEVISSKASDVTYLGNTLRGNKGSLVLRHGNRNRVDGNFFLDNVGGMRVYGHEHAIVNNYFEANSGSGPESTLILNSGCTESDTGNGSDCSRPDGVTVAHNTLVGNLVTHLVIGSSSSTRPLAPRNCTFGNNIVQGEEGTLVTFNATPENFAWTGNILWGAAAPGGIPSSGFTKVDPQLQRAADGLLRPSAGSPVIGASPTSPASLTTDMDGDPRQGLSDVGADQYTPLVPQRRPLLPADVGPMAP